MEMQGRDSQLNSGLKIPLIGLGTAALPQNGNNLNEIVAMGLKVGYMHFDTASIYGIELALGEALNGAFQSGLLMQDEVFVTSKFYVGDHEDPVSALKTSLNEVNIHVSAYSPLGSSGSFYGGNSAMENTVIHEIAKRHGKTVAQVLLRWGLEQGISVLPKSYNKGRIAENYHIFDWSLNRNDYEKISEIEQKKIPKREGLINSTTSPYTTVEYLWDGEV